MNPETGELYNVVDDDAEKARKLLEEGDLSGFPYVTEQEAREQGLIAVTSEQAKLLANMSPEQRRAWAAAVRKQAAREELLRVATMHPAAPVPGKTEDDRRQARNMRKRARRDRRR
jgi:hypothetical protein